MLEKAAYPGEAAHAQVLSLLLTTCLWPGGVNLSSASKTTAQPICLGWSKATARPKSVLLQELVCGSQHNYSKERGRGYFGAVARGRIYCTINSIH